MNEEKASRYHRLKRRTSVVSVLWSAALIVGLLSTGGSVVLRNLSAHAAVHSGLPPAAHPAATVAVYVMFFSALEGLVALPLAFYSEFLLDRRYGLSRDRFAGWVRDQLKSGALAVAFAQIGSGVVYFALRHWPHRWWAIGASAFSLITIVLASLAPVVLLPIFYRFKPLDRHALRERLLSLAERAGARVVGAYEWILSEKTRKANAALTGLGATRRILISDTMLAEYSDQEIEVILAHELAHHVHRDIWTGIAYETLLIFGGFFVADRVLARFGPMVGLYGPSDPAGLPLLLFAAGALSLVLLPAAHALSRAHERRADRYALQLTGNAAAFISAMRRLGAQNLAEEHPSKLVQLFFYSHPPISERIAAAEAFSG